MLEVLMRRPSKSANDRMNRGWGGIFLGGLLSLLWVAGCPSSGYFTDQESLDEAVPIGGNPNIDPNAVFAIIREDLGNIPNFLPDPSDTELWVRLTGSGLAGQNSRTLRAGMYNLGPNGVFDDGGIDDQLAEIATDVTWSIELFERIPGDSGPDDFPNVASATGVFTAGANTGTATVQAVHADYGTATALVLVVPPDWCTGEHQCVP